MNEDWRSLLFHISNMDKTNLSTSLDSISQLIDKLEDPESMQKNILTIPRKLYILKKLSLYMDHKDVLVLLKLSCITLKLIIELDKEQLTDGTYLSNTIKLLFKISKKEEFDSVFRQEKIIELLISLLTKVNWENLIFTIATLRNISYDNENQKIISNHGTIPLLSQIMSNTIKVLIIL